MKIVEQHFYNGPNVFAKSSGLRVICIDVPELPGRDLDPAGLQALLTELADAIPITAESTELNSPEFLQGCGNAPMGLVLALFEVATRDFWVEPKLGELLAFEDRQATLFVPCDDAPLGLAALRFAMAIANTSPELEAAQLAPYRQPALERYKLMRRRLRESWLDQSTLAVVRRAVARGIPYSRINNPGRFIHFGHGIHGHRSVETGVDTLSLVGSQLAADKFTTGAMLARSGLPTPKTQAIASAEDALKAAEAMRCPVVIKPRYGGKGKGVTVDIRTNEQIVAAIQAASSFNKGLVIERFIEGDDHRLLVVGGRLVAAARRTPARVIGDGVATVRQLVERRNKDPKCGVFAFERLFEPIEIDDEAREWLAKAGLKLDSVPAAGAAVRLRGAANISRGGDADDLTDVVHPDNRLAVERAARIVGVNVAGVDFLSPDIRRSWREVPSAILEVNSLPGLRPHFIADPNRDFVGPIVSLMFPEGTDGRVPTIGVTGSVGKTTTTMMAAAILARSGLRVGKVTTQGVWIGDENVQQGDLAGGGVARQLLQDPLVEAGVFELARGGLVKFGLTLDRLDVGMVLNIYDNHLGLNGAETRKDLARIKRLVIENARKLAVLNADDPLCLAMRRHAGCKRIAVVSARDDNAEALKHRDKGGLAAWLDAQDDLVLFDNKCEIGRIALRDLPDCWNGAFRPAAVNAMFAACAAHSLEIDFAAIAGALTDFKSDFFSNPGRNNYVENLPFRLFLSPADGPEATREVVELVRGIEIKGNRRLLITAAGDRPDSFIEEMARLTAGAFTDYFCTDWTDLRGRAPGEVCEALAAALRGAGVPPEQIHVIQPFPEAIRAAYSGMGPDDLLLDTFGSSAGTPSWFALRPIKLAGSQLVPA